mgnify:CR=1 FL=1
MLNAEQLQELLAYDPATGFLYWKVREPRHFNDSPRRPREVMCRMWNTAWAGKRALSTVGQLGYPYGTIFGKTYYAHRVIWCIVHGHWPDEIDHRNGDRTDNRLENLFDVPHRQNMKNSAKRSHNTSGVNGVWWDKRRKKWISEIMIDGRKVHLGQFDDISEAAKVRIPYETENSFSTSHGRR